MAMNQIIERIPEFVGNNTLLSFAFIGTLVALAVTQYRHMTRGYADVTPAGLTALMNAGKALVIDLSSAQDYQKAHIPGARHVALSQFDPESPDLARVKDMPVAVYCGRGVSANSAARRLARAGFSNVVNLQGGLRAWIDAQLPVESGAGKKKR